jgi:GT2 family glycosyltransferase
MSTECVAVILVNHNAGRYLARCLEALSRQTAGDPRVIVVDNASADGSADEVAAHHPHITLVRAERNLGFAAGNNLGLKHAGGARWIALLNPDAFPHPDWLVQLLAAAEAHPDHVPDAENRQRFREHLSQCTREAGKPGLSARTRWRGAPGSRSP